VQPGLTNTLLTGQRFLATFLSTENIDFFLALTSEHNKTGIVLSYIKLGSKYLMFSPMSYYINL
jgi:hypothetical protein